MAIPDYQTIILPFLQFLRDEEVRNAGRSSHFNFRCIFNWVIPRQSRIDAPGALHHIIGRVPGRAMATD